MAHELQPSQGRGPRCRDALLHHVRTRVLVVQGRDGHDVGLALQELHEQGREAPELRAFGIGPPPLGDLAGALRDRARRALEQVAHARGRREARAGQLGDGALDPFQQVGEGREIAQRCEAAQPLKRAQHVLQRVVRQRVRAQRLRRAVQCARDGRAFARHERAGASVEAEGFGRSDLGGRAARELVQLRGQRLRLRAVGLAPVRRAAHEDLEVVDRAHGELLRVGVPGTAALAQRARQRLDARGRLGGRLLVRHQGTAAQRPRQPHELVCPGRLALLEQRVQPLEILPCLEGEEVGHAEGFAWGRHGGNKLRRLPGLVHKSPHAPHRLLHPPEDGIAHDRVPDV